MKLKQLCVPLEVVYGPKKFNPDGRVIVVVPNYRKQEMMFLIESDDGVEIPVEFFET